MDKLIDLIGLYVHIPFCAVKCPYCDFYSVKYESALEESYTNAVVSQMKSYSSQNIKADTLYFGGGTPSLMKPKNICRIIDTAKEVFILEDGDAQQVEITLEGNPNSAIKSKLSDWSSAGINRLSFGAQSSLKKELDALGRNHDNEQVYNVVNNAVKCGIDNISLDLMIGTPYQTLISLTNSIDFITSLPIKHVSAYILKVEESTPYYGSELLSYCADEDGLAEMYLSTVEQLKGRGFNQYEISNFALKGFESRHNLKYWQGSNYIGFGASAHSHMGKLRFCHPDNIQEYISTCGTNVIELDNNASKADEYIMLNLRLSKGLDLNFMESEFSILKQDVLKAAEKYLRAELMLMDDNYISLTPKGFLLSNSIISDMLYKLL